MARNNPYLSQDKTWMNLWATTTMCMVYVTMGMLCVMMGMVLC